MTVRLTYRSLLVAVSALILAYLIIAVPSLRPGTAGAAPTTIKLVERAESDTVNDLEIRATRSEICWALAIRSMTRRMPSRSARTRGSAFARLSGRRGSASGP